MNQHTPEQVDEAVAALEQLPLTTSKQFAVIAEVFKMLRAYAATLRQQAEAKAGVTDEVVQRACVAYDGAEDRTYYGIRRRFMRAALEAVWPQAALAQSTQGDAPIIKNLYGPHPLMIDSGTFWRCDHGNTSVVGCPACWKATHAERARVPDGWKRPAALWLIAKADEQRAINEKYPKHAACYPAWGAFVTKFELLASELLAAAPSQPAKLCQCTTIQQRKYCLDRHVCSQATAESAPSQPAKGE